MYKDEEKKRKCATFQILVPTGLHSVIRNLTYLADNVDISVSVYDDLTHFFRVCKMYLLKVRTM